MRQSFQLFALYMCAEKGGFLFGQETGSVGSNTQNKSVIKNKKNSPGNEFVQAIPVMYYKQTKAFLREYIMLSATHFVCGSACSAEVCIWEIWPGFAEKRCNV